MTAQDVEDVAGAVHRSRYYQRGKEACGTSAACSTQPALSNDAGQAKHARWDLREGHRIVAPSASRTSLTSAVGLLLLLPIFVGRSRNQMVLPGARAVWEHADRAWSDAVPNVEVPDNGARR
jgi:hypothetical protein